MSRADRRRLMRLLKDAKGKTSELIAGIGGGEQAPPSHQMLYCEHGSGCGTLGAKVLWLAGEPFVLCKPHMKLIAPLVAERAWRG